MASTSLKDVSKTSLPSSSCCQVANNNVDQPWYDLTALNLVWCLVMMGSWFLTLPAISLEHPTLMVDLSQWCGALVLGIFAPSFMPAVLCRALFHGEFTNQVPFMRLWTGFLEASVTTVTVLSAIYAFSTDDGRGILLIGNWLIQLTVARSLNEDEPDGAGPEAANPACLTCQKGEEPCHCGSNCRCGAVCQCHRYQSEESQRHRLRRKKVLSFCQLVAGKNTSSSRLLQAHDQPHTFHCLTINYRCKPYLEIYVNPTFDFPLFVRNALRHCYGEESTFSTKPFRLSVIPYPAGGSIQIAQVNDLVISYTRSNQLVPRTVNSGFPQWSSAEEDILKRLHLPLAIKPIDCKPDLSMLMNTSKTSNGITEEHPDIFHDH